MLPHELPNLAARRSLDSISRARVFAVTAEDTAREVNTKELRIAAACWIFCRLQRDAVHRTGDRAKITGHTPFAAVRIARENDSAAVTRSQVGLLVRILDRDSPPEPM